MQRYWRHGLTILFSGIVLSACSSTQIRESWTNPEFQSISLGKVLVIAVGENEPRRAQFEVELAAILSERGANAVARDSIRELRGNPGREKVEKYVREQSFDQVLVTQVSGMEREEIERAGYTEYEVYGFRGRFGRYWVTDVDRIERPATTETRVYLFVETSLFETDEGRVVWRMRTETRNPQLTNTAGELTSAISRRMGSDGLLN
ncbi:MAG: hypothetical protein AAF358_12645 [Pseudomonadota bacterium]